MLDVLVFRSFSARCFELYGLNKHSLNNRIIYRTILIQVGCDKNENVSTH